jgi:transcriptional regulator with XRE-family HTH domain
MAGKANPKQVAINGHAAGCIRQAMKTHGLGLEAVAKLVGCTASGVSWWVRAFGCPSEKLRQKVSTVLDIPIDDLMPRNMTEVSQRSEPPSKALVVVQSHKKKKKVHERLLPMADKPPLPPTVVESHQSQLLAFVANGDGTARITLDVILPMAHAIPIINSLLLHGISQQPARK